MSEIRRESETRREDVAKAYDEVFRYYQLLEDETDRGAAVLAVAFFEEQLKKAIEFSNTAFKDFRLSFRLNIEIAYTIKLFDQETRDGLCIVRKIRNKFAHESDPLTFELGEVADECRKLRTDRTPANLRERYLFYLREVEVNLRRSTSFTKPPR